jgi:DNA-binding Lrp family transcriptional regulator
MTIYLSDYQTFNSTQELNHNVKQHEKANHEELTASQREVLRFISRYSVKYAGASHLKTSTIAEGVDKSDRTVRRILGHLEALGIIERINTLRPKSGGSGANIIVILPFKSERLSDGEVSEKSRQTTVKAQDSANEPLHKRVKTSTLLETGLKNAIPTPIYDALSPFYEAKDIQRLTGVVFRAKSSVSKNLRLEDNVEAFRVTVMDVVRRFKGGSLRNMDSYLYVSLRKLFRKLLAQEVFGWK